MQRRDGPEMVSGRETSRRLQDRRGHLADQDDMYCTAKTEEKEVFVMSRRQATFRKNDVTRAIEAVRAGGISIGRVEICDDKIVIVSSVDEVGKENPLDEWLKSNAR